MLVKGGKIALAAGAGRRGGGHSRAIGGGPARLSRPDRLPRALRLRREDHRVRDRDRQRRAGRLYHLLGYFLNNEAYGDVFRREQDYALRARHVDYGFHFTPPTSCISRSSASTCSDYGVTSFKYFMNFKGEEGRYLGWTAPTTASSTTC